jgi:hypothetical protein
MQLYVCVLVPVFSDPLISHFVRRFGLRVLRRIFGPVKEEIVGF